MEKKKVVVEIFGEVYPLKSDEPADYVRQLRDVAKKTRSFSGTKIGVLAALQLADEYYKLKKDYDELLALLEEPK